MVSKRKIKRKFGEKIYRRGLDYYREGRVLSTVKMGDELIGKVSGTRDYKTDVGLKTLTCECSCPYQGRCKHCVALLLSYLNGRYEDGDEFLERVRQMSEDDLRNFVEKTVRSNPTLLSDFETVLPEENGDVEDEEVESWIRKIEEGYWNEETVSEFSKYIRKHKQGLKKPQLFHVLEFLFDNSGNMGWFYDDYADRYFGDQLFESIGETLGETGLNEEDSAKLKRMRKKDEMGYFDSLSQGIIENPKKIEPEGVEKLLTPRQLAELHINRRDFGEAERIIERGEIHPEEKFNLLLKIDGDKAQNFAREEQVHAPLVRFLYEDCNEDEIRELVPEMTEEDLRNLSEGELEILFETCPDFREEIFDVLYSKVMQKNRKSASYELCGDMALELEDAERAKEIFEVTNSGELKKRIAEFLIEGGRSEGEEYGKRAASWMVNKRGDYELAVKCITMLRETMDGKEWRNYLKETYRNNWRKRDLWEKLENRGIGLQKRKGKVYLEESPKET